MKGEGAVGCAISGVIGKSREPFSGRTIIQSFALMHNWGDGLGVGSRQKQRQKQRIVRREMRWAAI